jgi:hypothetical protein
MSDRTVLRWIKRRGSRIPEDRLRATLFSGAVVVPLTLLAAGELYDIA